MKTGWEVITGGNDFFEVTKGFHNALHGGEYTLTQQARDVFMLHTEQNRQRMKFGEDFVVIHDPQPAGLIASKTDGPAQWVWRCHIDLSNPNAESLEVSAADGRALRLPPSFRPRPSRDSWPFRRRCFIRASTRCRKRTKNWTSRTFRKSATTSGSIARGRS